MKGRGSGEGRLESLTTSPFPLPFCRGPLNSSLPCTAPKRARNVVKTHKRLIDTLQALQGIWHTTCTLRIRGVFATKTMAILAGSASHLRTPGITHIHKTAIDPEQFRIQSHRGKRLLHVAGHFSSLDSIIATSTRLQIARMCLQNAH